MTFLALPDGDAVTSLGLEAQLISLVTELGGLFCMPAGRVGAGTGGGGMAAVDCRRVDLTGAGTMLPLTLERVRRRSSCGFGTGLASG